MLYDRGEGAGPEEAGRICAGKLSERNCLSGASAAGRRKEECPVYQ